jgi:outer membrane immunogenic protein
LFQGFDIKELIMRKVLFLLAASAAIASPALAGEARLEARGGVYWEPGNTQATAGAAAGYDADLGTGAFLGGEVSADKVLESNRRVMLGITGRAGLKPTPDSKLFAAGGYTTKSCALCEDAIHAGGGYEQKLGSKLYGKVEYRHFFTNNSAPDGNTVMAGLGLKF